LSERSKELALEPVVETPIRVRYAETDAMGVVHHASYVVWLEVGRSEWMRRNGSSYADLEASGYHLPVVGLSVRYLAAARYDDLLTLRTWIAEWRSRQVRFGYELTNAEGRCLVRAETTHVSLGRDGEVVALPAELRRVLAGATRPAAPPTLTR
jgi:acyl-CoA thioester hydrolase